MGIDHVRLHIPPANAPPSFQPVLNPQTLSPKLGLEVEEFFVGTLISELILADPEPCLATGFIYSRPKCKSITTVGNGITFSDVCREHDQV